MFNKKKLSLSVVPFFLLLFFGLLFTSYPEESFKHFERYLSFILVPIVFLFFQEKELLKIKKVFLNGLFYGSIISILILLTLNFRDYFMAKEGFIIEKDLLNYYYTNKNFTKPLNIHPTYLGVYYLTSIVFLKELFKNKNLRIILISFFGLALLFLNSRIIFFGALLIMILFVFQKTRELVFKRKYKELLYYSIFAMLGIFLSLNVISRTYIGSRLKNIYKFEISQKIEENFNSSNKGNPRLARWKSAVKLIKERPFTGYGIADEYQNLQDQFEKDGLLNAAKSRYNAHNQYLGFGIKYGLVGFLVIFFFFLSNIKLSIRTNNYRYLLVILIIACTCFVENYFDRNSGITFSAIFFTVFSYLLLDNESV